MLNVQKYWIMFPSIHPSIWKYKYIRNIRKVALKESAENLDAKLAA